MVSKILLWSSFGVGVRLWQLGMEMTPLFARNKLYVYPLYATIGGSFGYWLQGVESSQMKLLTDRRDALLEKRRRRAEREGEASIGGEEGVMAT